MTDNIDNTDNNEVNSTPNPAPAPTGKKLGRKSKKELLAALNLASTTSNELVEETEQNTSSSLEPVSTPNPASAPTPTGKKRGRKPKGGKIIQQVEATVVDTEIKQNVILHLKCSMKDLESHNNCEDSVKAYDSNADLSYDLLLNHENNTFNNNSTYFYLNNNTNNNTNNSNLSFSKKNKQVDYNSDDEYDDD